MKFGFYESYILRYIEASQETRDASRRHWMECHKKNLKANREDLIIFSAKMLASIDMAQEYIERQESGEHVTVWEYISVANA